MNEDVKEDTEESLQDCFINDIIQENAIVHIYLSNGVRLDGIIESHDEHSIILLQAVGRRPQLLYKRHITTILV